VRPAVSVVVPVYNGRATIAATLDALAAQRLEDPYEVLVVDGGSTDGTLELLGERAGENGLRLLHNPLREPASARALGVEQATAPLLAFTDADCQPAPGWLAAGLRALAAADIVQGRVEPAQWAGPFDRTLAVMSEYGLYETANLFVRREVFERAGGFEPLPGLLLPDGTHFGEDTWFVWRARRRGARTTFAAEAVVRHAVFRRRVPDALIELRRRRHFPLLVALIPELREVFLHRRVFLSPDSERFDLAVASLALGLLARRPAALLGVCPYALLAVARLRRVSGDQVPRVLAGQVAGDLITLVELARGSLAARTPVL
jgi:glycosyltransferase involved in cell wall biosynthesis